MTRPVVSVDLGDTTVAAVVDVAPAGPDPEPVDLETDLAAVFDPGDGDALVSGAEARRRAAADPARYEPTPRRRADDGELLLGTRTVGVAEAWGAVVSGAVARAGPRLRGGRPRGLVLTHPFDWDTGRVELLRRAGSGLADELVLTSEPVAAAAFAGWMRPRRSAVSRPTAVLDVGALAATASVVADDGEVLAHRRDESFGGADADEMLLAHLLADPSTGGRAADRVREVAAGGTLGDRRHRQVLLDDVRAAKELLSDAEQAEIPLPGGGTAAWLARGEAEEVLLVAWRRVVAVLADVVAAAGATPERLDGVWLTGGAARTPQLATLVHRELGVPATVAPDPGLVVARGALVVVRRTAAARVAEHGGEGGRAHAEPYPPRPVGSSGPVGSSRSVGPVGPVGPVGRVGSGGPVASGGSEPAGVASAPPGAGTYDLAAPFGPDDPLGWDTDTDIDTDVELAAGLDGGGARGNERRSAPRRPDPEHDTVEIAAGPRSGAPTGYDSDPDPFWSPAPRRGFDRRRRRVAVGALAAAVVIAGAVVGAVVLRGDGSPRGTPIDAYTHRFVVPVGWSRATSDDTSRRTLLRPDDAPHGTALIAVQDNAADDADPARLREQLRAQFDSARAQGDPVTDLQPDARLAGRDVVRYRQDVSPGVVVDWVVVLAPRSQVTVGCRYDVDRTTGEQVRAACEQVVATVGPPGS